MSVHPPAPRPAGATAATPVPVAGPPRRAGRGVVLLRIVGALVAVALLAGGTLAVVGQFLERERTTTSSYPGIRTVVADTDIGSIEVRAGAAGSPVQVRRTDGWSFAEPTASQQATGDTLELRGRCAEAGVSLGRCSVDYAVTVPAGTALQLSSSTGSVAVEGVDGDVTATTSTGSVELTGLTSDAVTAESSTGAVEVSFARPPTRVRAVTSTGAVEVLLPRDGTAYAVQARSSIGGTEVTVPVDSRSPRTVEARTSTGFVQVGHGDGADAD